jgi:hypothetical protein
MRSIGQSLVAGFVALWVFADSAHAQPRVAIVAAAGNLATDPRFTDPQARLQASGFFSAVDIINATTPNPTPTLAELLNYDAVIVWTNNQFTSRPAMGDVLADYVDAGGGVVVAVFAVNSTTSGLQGRWLDQGYAIISPGSGNEGSTANVGVIAQPGHPIMDGVTDLDSNTSTRPNTAALTSHGVLVSSWSDGMVLAAVSSQYPQRVDIGLYPPSSAVTATFWDQTTDGGRFMANALLYATNATPPAGTDLFVTTSAPATCTISPGGAITYPIRVRNIAADLSGPVTLTIDLPAPATAIFASSLPAPSTTSPTQLVYNLAPLASGAQVDIVLNLTAVGAGSTAGITATVSTTSDINPANNSAVASTDITPAAPTTAVARAIFSNDASLANSAVPGVGGRFSAFNRPYASPDGSWWILRADTDLATTSDLVLLRSQTTGSPAVILQEGVSLTVNGALGLFDEGAEINNAGVVAIAGDDGGATASDEFVATTTDGTTITDVAREGSPIPSIPGVNYGTGAGSASILANGQAGFSFTSTPTGSTAYFSANGNTIIAQLGVTQPTGASNTIDAITIDTGGDGGFALDASGAHSIYQAEILGEASTSDQVIVADGAVILQEGVTFLPGLAAPVNGTSKNFTMGPTGVWMVRGSNTDAAEDWVIRGTGSTIAQIVKTNDPIFTSATETWQEDTTFTGTFFINAADGQGNYVIGGLTSEPNDFADAVLVLNNQVVIARENDPVDLNGNGMFDDGAFIRSFGNDDIAFIGDAVLLNITYRDTPGALCGTNNTSRGEAFVRIPLPTGASGACCVGTTCSVVAGAGACTGVYQGNGSACGPAGNPTTCCPANFNDQGGVTVQDIFDFLAAYFSGAPGADFNGVGGVTVQDIFDFLAAYFTGCN